MNLFPMKQPTLALSISEDALFLVEVKKSWRKTTFHEVKKVSLPSGVIRLSSAKPNIENMEMFVEQLRILVEPLKTPISIALSLPDLCARTSVFEFSTFPTKKGEQTALLNWRFQQDLKLDTSQSRLSYAVYVPTSLANSSKQENPEKVKVLGTAIRNEIVEQYEHACLDLNLMPVSVSISGLDIFDLYQPTIKDILEVEDRRTAKLSSGAMFLFISHWGFTFFAFHEGCPNFARTKAIAIRPSSSPETHDTSILETEKKEKVFGKNGENVQEAIGSQNICNEEDVTHPYSLTTTTKVEKEILATLQYYLETFSQDDSMPSLANLFVVTDLEYGHSLLPTSEHLQQTAKVSGVSVSDIQVTELSSSTHLNKRESDFVHEYNILYALPGYASLRVA